MRAFAIAVTLATAATVATPTRADDLVWKDEWTRFRTAEYIGTGIAGAGALGVYVFATSKTNPSWQGGILFDDAVRDGLRLRNPGARDTIRHFSDAAAIGTVAYAVFDTVVWPFARGNFDVGWQLAWMDAEAFAIDTLLVTSMYDAIGRGRPSYEDCQRNADFDPLCRAGATASFPSGHTATAFTAAGLSCAHHRVVPLYGGGAGDTVACVTTLTLATATATFRLMGDRHYVTDVVAGGTIGFAIGYLLPTLAHYGWSQGPRANDRASTPHVELRAAAPGAPLGISAHGSF